jgi:hypothetical protein
VLLPLERLGNFGHSPEVRRARRSLLPGPRLVR